MKTRQKHISSERSIAIAAKLAGEDMTALSIAYTVDVYEKYQRDGKTNFLLLETLLQTSSVDEAITFFNNYDGDGKISFADLSLDKKLRLAFEAGESYANCIENATSWHNQEPSFEEWLEKVATERF